MAEYEIAAQAETRARYQRIGFALGPIAALIILFLSPPDGLNVEGWRVVALLAWMAIWWASEAIPVPATSILPIVVIPLLGVGTVREATAPFANPVIYLLLGGFVLALALERWNLHRRIALGFLIRVGDHKLAILGGFMIVAAFLSMWISNTATVMMMMPIALSVALAVRGGEEKLGDPFALMLLLGIAYAASIGGMATLVGTTTNAVAAGYMRESFGVDLGFADWIRFGLPTVLIFLPIAWIVLTLLTRYRLGAEGQASNPAAQEYVRQELGAMGRMTEAEKRVAWLCVLIAALWLSRRDLNLLLGGSFLSDAGIAIGGAIALFLIPAGKAHKDKFLLSWNDTTRMNWGVLLLFGGGLSLASAVDRSGLAAYLGQALAEFANLPPILMIGLIVTLVVFLTELTSNTATAATLMPVLGALAREAGVDPMLLVAPVAMAASAAFMLPVATGPNAVVYGSGRVRVPDMAKTGLWLNMAAIIVMTMVAHFLLPLILG